MKLDFNQRVKALMQAAAEVVKIQREVATRRKEKEESEKFKKEFYLPDEVKKRQ
jgi:hypothetical protein|nr:MAG TPA: hypothetical protein [Caudoviricetes sp.]